MRISVNNYLKELENKKNYLKTLLAKFYLKELEVFNSQPTHFRQRVEFKIWQENDDLFYAMNKGKEIIKFKEFKNASKIIFDLMPILLTELKKTKILKAKLFQVEFLSSLAGDIIVSLIYHKKLDEFWELEAKKLAEFLKIKIIGRAKNQKIMLNNQGFILEELKVNNKIYKYRQYEQSFSQPNAKVCEKMLTWVSNLICDKNSDLLELYCGNGNFTIPLSFNFNKVFATEISKTSIKALGENLILNNIKNIEFARLSAEEFSEAMEEKRIFNRLKQKNINLKTYNFSTVLIDPPRAGVDNKTLELISKFKNIIYISCNPLTLLNNLEVLTKTHKINKVALFDQFPHSPHIETGVFLTVK